MQLTSPLNPLLTGDSKSFEWAVYKQTGMIFWPTFSFTLRAKSHVFFPFPKFSLSWTLKKTLAIKNDVIQYK